MNTSEVIDHYVQDRSAQQVSRTDGIRQFDQRV